ncbi:MAG: hypothetical protein LBR79_05150 [Oscillospiraceae bacterium]|jgi:hypothetical protein|nr:hypothetical protein [Oscillospiraceae bacterium]
MNSFVKSRVVLTVAVVFCSALVGCCLKPLNHNTPPPDISPPHLIKPNTIQLEKIKNVYCQIFKQGFTYDQASFERFQNTQLETHGEVFREEVDYVARFKKGGCRQFTSYVIDEFHKNGIVSYPVIVVHSKTRVHQAVLYKVNGEFFVADLTQDIYECHNSSGRNQGANHAPRWYNIPFRQYIELMQPAKAALLNMEYEKYNQYNLRDLGEVFSILFQNGQFFGNV